MSAINTNRCSPVQMRKALEVVETMKRSGMEFLPIPVLNESDREKLLLIMADRLERLAAAADGSAA